MTHGHEPDSIVEEVKAAAYQRGFVFSPRSERELYAIGASRLSEVSPVAREILVNLFLDEIGHLHLSEQRDSGGRRILREENVRRAAQKVGGKIKRGLVPPDVVAELRFISGFCPYC